MDRERMPELLEEPSWELAAQSLVDGCIDLSHGEDRVAMLAAVCDGLGNELYPAFLRILAIIGRHGDHAARAAVAGALVHAIRTGRLPSGRRSAWGAAFSSNLATNYGSTRSLGPLEYLCAWHAQAEPGLAIGADSFHAAARAVMDLIVAHPEARLLYCEKLLADVADPIGGALARRTRAALHALATTWAAGASSTDASASFLRSLADAQEPLQGNPVLPPAWR
jgi:hypothetical protein